MIYGRYRGKFPENVIAKGLQGDLSSFSVDLSVQSAKDMPLDKVRSPSFHNHSQRGFLSIKTSRFYIKCHSLNMFRYLQRM